jgi:hypothetical protein
MAEEIRLDVVTRADNRGLLEASREIDKLKGRTDALDSSTTSLDRSTDNLGDSFDDTSKDAFDLSAAIEDARKKSAALRAEFARTGEQSLLKDVRSEETLIRRLEKIAEQIKKDQGLSLTPVFPSSSGAASFGDLGPSLGRSMAPAIIAGVTGGLAPLLPGIGAMIAGTVAGAVGTGGVIGGVVMASKDERVRSAWKSFADDIAAEFFSGGGAFVQPVIDSLAILERGVEGMRLGEAFEQVAPLVTTIARGFADFGTNIMPGLNEAFANMGPFADVAAKGIGDLGTSLGGFIRDLSQSQGAVQGLETTFMLLNGAVRLTGGGLEILSDIYGGFVESADIATRAAEGFALATGNTTFVAMLDTMARKIEEIGTEGDLTLGRIKRGSNDVESAIQGQVTSWEKLKEGIVDAAEAQSDFMDLAMSVPEAADAYEAAIDDLTQSLKDNGTTIDAGTEKGRANRDAFRDAIKSAEEHRLATIRLTGDVTRANAEFKTEIERIEGIGEKAGITKEELRGMAGNYDITFRISTVGRAPRITYGGTVQSFGAGILEYAGGGEVPGPKGMAQLAVVHGGEYVVSNEMRSGGAPTFGGGRMAPIVVTDPFGQMLFTWIRSAVASAGGDVQAFFGQS